MSSEKVPPSVRPNSQHRDALDAGDTGRDEVKEEMSEEVGMMEGDEGSTTRNESEVQCNPVGDDEVEGHEDADEDAEEEHANPEGLRDPGQPSPAEKAEHDLTHIPYRSWCTHCVRGKAKGRQSRRIAGEAAHSSCPRVRFDYCSITERARGQEESEGQDPEGEAAEAEGAKPDGEETVEGQDGQAITVLVMQESQCQSVWAYVVQSKGASEAWVVDQVAEDLDTVGLKRDRIVIKSDQEASAQELSRAVARSRETDYGSAIESSSVGESNSNASIERAIQDVEAQVRTLRSALEARIGTSVPIKSQIVEWIVRHAACLISRCRVRADGKTAIQRIRGRNPVSKIAEFGETVHFKIPKTQSMPGKYEDRLGEGLWLGFEMRTAEHLVGTNVGVFRVSSVMRRPIDERWSAARIRELAGSPRQPVPGQASRRTPAYSRRHNPAPPADEQPRPQPRDPRQQFVRKWKIYRDDVLDAGPTPGCAGCRAIMRGLDTRAGHTQQCRDRIEEAIDRKSVRVGKECRSRWSPYH